MNPTASMVTRAELRQQWGSLVALALLIAVVSGATMTAVIGADRSSSAVDRFRTTTGAADLWYQTNDSETAPGMLEAARRDPAVEEAGFRYLINLWPSTGSTDIAVMADIDGHYGRKIDRPYVLSGRMPSLDSPDEVLLNEQAARLTGLKVGDHLRAQTWSKADLASLDGSNFPGFHGPKLDLVVVGIGRTPEELSGDLRRTSPYAVASPAFLTTRRDLGAWPPSIEVRLRPGARHDHLDATMSRLQTEAAAQAGGTGGGFWVAALTASDVYLDSVRTATHGLVIGLLLFAAAALAAGALAVAQAVRRHLAAGMTPSRTLATLGMTRREIARVRSRPIGLAAAMGALGGAAIAVGASPILPIGLVRRAEVDPGAWVNPLLIGVGVALSVVTVWGWAKVSVRREFGRDRTTRSPRRTPLSSRLAARSGATPAVSTGLRLAGDRSRAAIPVRSAFVGVAICVVGVVAAGVITTSYHDLVNSPPRWGVPWSSSPDYNGDQPIDTVLSRLAEDPRVDAVSTAATTSFVLDDHVISVTTLDSTKGHLAFTTLRGRLPRSPTEVALGTATAKALRVSIGDTVDVTPLRVGETVPLTVVGTVVLPATDNEYAVNVGAAATPEGVQRYGNTNDISQTPVIHFAPGTDTRRAERDLSTSIDGLEFNVFTEPRPPGIISSLNDSRDIAVWLAVFLTVLAVIGMLHVLVVSTRRRRGELGTLRALGMRGRQVQRAVTVQAIALVIAGVAVGAPVGFLIGRFVWRSLVGKIGASIETAVPIWVLALLVPVAVAIGSALSWWPGRSARRPSPAESLRAE